MKQQNRPVGIIAGDGPLPALASSRLTDRGHAVFVCVLEGNPTDELRDHAREVISFDPGELESIPRFFLDKGVEELYLLGNVDKKALYDNGEISSSDETTKSLLERLPDKGDQFLIQAATRYLSSRGLKVKGLDDIFGDRMIGEGLVAGPEPGEENMKTLSYLQSLARSFADREVGQTLLGKRQSVVAVEAVEGTQNVIERAGKLAGDGCVMVKSARSDQDTRFDVPVVGSSTIRALSEINASVLAAQAGNVIWVQQSQSKEIASQNNISIVGFTYPDSGVLGRVTRWLTG